MCITVELHRTRLSPYDLFAAVSSVSQWHNSCNGCLGWLYELQL